MEPAGASHKRHQAAIVVADDQLRNAAEEGERMNLAIDLRRRHRRRVGPHIAASAVRKVEHEEVRLALYPDEHNNGSPISACACPE
jgi:hypothetical protein